MSVDDLLDWSLPATFRVPSNRDRARIPAKMKRLIFVRLFIAILLSKSNGYVCLKYVSDHVLLQYGELRIFLAERYVYLARPEIKPSEAVTAEGPSKSVSFGRLTCL